MFFLFKQRLLFLGAAFLVGSFFIFSDVQAATTYYVSPTGSDTNAGTSTAPFKTIQKCANIVNAGDTCIVKDGVYTDTDGNDRIVNLTRGGSSAGGYVTFRSENKWGAVLDGQSNATDYAFVVYNAVQYVKIQDFEIKGVNNTAIFSNPNTTANATGFIEVYRNKIHDVSRRQIDCNDLYGRTAIYGSIYTHDWKIDKNTAWNIGRIPNGCASISNADSAHDHFVYTGHTGATSSVHTYNWDITNNIFYEGDGHFAGFFAAIGVYGANIKIINNTVVGRNVNSSAKGVIYLNNNLSNLNIQNNIFYGTNGAAISNSTLRDGSGFTIYNNLTNAPSILATTTACYNNEVCYLGTSSGNMVSVDPKFVNLANNDFHLQSTSPAIGKGLSTNAPQYDFDGVTRGSSIDIGAFEYASGGTPPPTPGDTTPPAIPTGLQVQ